MAILGVATEPGQLLAASGMTPAYYSTTGENRFDETYVRGAFMCADSDNRGGIQADTTYTDVWFHGSVSIDDDYTGYALMFFSNGLSEELIEIRCSSSSNATYTVYYNPSGTLTQLSTDTFTLLPDYLYNIDIHVIEHSTAGEMSVYVNGALVYTYTGALTLNSSIDSIIVAGSYSNNSRPTYWSQLIFATESTINMCVHSFPPTGDSSLTNWTGSYADVDEFSDSGTDYISTDTDGAVALFTKGTLSGAYVDPDIVAVAVSSISAISSGSTVTDNQHALHIGSTDYVSSDLSVPNDSSKAYRSTIWETNPDTSSAWTVSDVNGLTFGIKAKT